MKVYLDTSVISALFDDQNTEYQLNYCREKNMHDITEKELNAIKEEIEKEFPHNFALQQVHIARKILNRKAELAGLSYFEYMMRLERDHSRVRELDDASAHL